MVQHESIVSKEHLQHSLSLDARKILAISGVCDVERFDEHSIVLATGEGMLLISGSELHIDRLSLETGELSVKGRIDRLVYSDESESEGFWSRLFR